MRKFPNCLFNDGEFDEVLGSALDSIPGGVEPIPQGQFAATSTDTLVENVVSYQEALTAPKPMS